MSKNEIGQLESIAEDIERIRNGYSITLARRDGERIRNAVTELTRLSALNRELVEFAERCAGNDHLNPELWRQMCQMNARAVLAKAKG